jgi:hypothetical protein
MLLLGAGVALSAVFLMSQGGTGQPSSAWPWPPARQNVVHVFERGNSTGFGTPLPEIPAGGTLAVYTVPPDRWLTIVQAEAVVSHLVWAETLGGALHERGAVDSGTTTGESPTRLFHSPGRIPELGWVFRPGSTVVLKNTSTSPSSPGYYAFLGYETRN